MACYSQQKVHDFKIDPKSYNLKIRQTFIGHASKDDVMDEWMDPNAA